MNEKRTIRSSTIVGLEVHVQLATRTKMFCGCAIEASAPPNSCVCPVCLGHPGTLPVINRTALDYAIRAGLALGCSISRLTKWDRKAYFYPDLPKNYQISQYDLPLATNGSFEIPVGSKRKRIRIRRAHLEEDAGKSMHDVADCTLVDLNRAGTPLLEIVTEPDIRSPEEAYAFCTELQTLMVYLGVSEGVMQKGQMRFEPNINVAIEADGKQYRTPICEVKNLNSFRAVKGAVAYESQRQTEAWLADPEYLLGRRPNENRGWVDDRGVTEFQRVKEATHDYRYFPDPDLVPVVIRESMLKGIHSALPELPVARRRRLIEKHGLPAMDAHLIVARRATADLFDEVVAAGAPPDIAAKQFVNVWLKLGNERGAAVGDLGVGAARMAELARITAEGVVSSTAANRIAEAMLANRAPPTELAEALGLLQVHDPDTTACWIEQVFAANRQAVEDAIASPKKAKAVTGFLRGQVMKVSGGKADPNLVGDLIQKRLKSEAQ
jgi:aspartyl-tRNA(Asn)/glutamyl-tRNA(Gln) amidotransferase subunit B